MKPEEMYQQLKELAERLNISVSEQNLRKTGVNAQSGFCIIKNRKLFILDKTKSIFDKNTLISSFLKKSIDDDMYIMPAVRDFIQKHAETAE